MDKVDHEYAAFLAMQISFRIFSEKDLKNLVAKAEERNCISLKRRFCILPSNENKHNSAALANITAVQVCLLDTDKRTFFALQGLIKDSCFENENITENFEGCF